MSGPPFYVLECPFPTDDPLFARGVEWELFRQKIKHTFEAFNDYISDQNVTAIITLCQNYEREATSSSTDWPGWTMVKVAKSPEPQCQDVS